MGRLKPLKQPVAHRRLSRRGEMIPNEPKAPLGLSPLALRWSIGFDGGNRYGWERGVYGSLWPSVPGLLNIRSGGVSVPDTAVIDTPDGNPIAGIGSIRVEWTTFDFVAAWDGTRYANLAVTGWRPALEAAIGTSSDITLTGAV